MSLDKLEIWVHDHILKNDTIRHVVYGAYQRTLYMVSPKIKYEGAVERITPDDGYEYLFGYYDKCPWSDDGKFILALRVKNASSEADSCKPADIVRINVTTKKVEKLATTHSWNVQQGCMAQWLSNHEILYNDFRNGKYCSVILNITDKTERIIQMPVYAMSQDKKTALSLDFSRLHRLRPGYGYSNIPETTKGKKCPNTTCIWKINIETGDIVPLLKYTDFAAFDTKDTMKGAEHKVNHLMISPDGTRFMVLHRWFQKGVKYTRLVTCNMDGTEMYNLSDDDFVSHCCWKNNEEILSYLNKNDGGKGYYLMKDKTHSYERCWTQLAMDGHPTYSYDGRYVVTDTYPDRKRIQSLYVMNGKRVTRIARVFSPFKYGGDTRCDLHPRWSKDGKQICFDASFGGKRSVCVVNTDKAITEQIVSKFDETESPSVSIIMPCYNAAKLIDETMESLEMQTSKDFELICINDGSSDNTLEKLQEWKNKKLFKMHIINQENGGVSKARNRGIEEARGHYIMFLDSDDIYHPSFVELLLKGMDNADISYCRLSRNLEDVYQCNLDHANFQSQSIKKAMDKLLYEMGKYGFYCYVYKKDLIERIGLRFDENTKYGEDREFNWKYICHCRKASWIDLPLYGYRINPLSATQTSASWRKTDLLKAVKRIELYLDNNCCKYSNEFKSYMYARAMWAVAKTFAVSKDTKLFNRLQHEYDVKSCMKVTAKDSNKLVKIASLLYLINPYLYYRAVGLKK